MNTLTMGYLVVIALSGITSAYIAQDKNKNGMTWFILGLLGGIFAILAIGFARPVSDEEANSGRKLSASEFAEAKESIESGEYLTKTAYAEKYEVPVVQITVFISRGLLKHKEVGGQILVENKPVDESKF